MKPLQTYTRSEELFNSITHGLGILFALVTLVLLTFYSVQSGTTYHIVSSVVYGLSMVALYTASTLYHSFRDEGLKRIFKILDHSAIYLLIAGTYTPFTLITLRGAWGWSLFGVVWGIALAGIIFKAFYAGRFKLASTILYLLMGWLIVIAIKPLAAHLPLQGLLWLISGGLCYTFGAVFYLWRSLPYNHAIWHLFVLGGSVCHFFSIYWYVLPTIH